MANTLRDIYKDGIHGLSERITAEIIALIPIIFYFAANEIAIEISREIFVEDLCTYMPGATYDKNHSPDIQSVAKGKWMNCTETAKFDQHFPQIPKTSNEIMLQQSMKEYFGMELQETIARYQMLETIFIMITSLVLFRLCRWNLNSIIALQISGWELALAVTTFFRVGTALILGGMSMEKSKMSQLQNYLKVLEAIIWVGYVLTLIIIIKLIYDADNVAKIEKEKEKITHHDVPKYMKGLHKNKSMKVISHRQRRKSSFG